MPAAHLHIRSLVPGDAAEASGLLAQLGYPTPVGALEQRIRRMAAAGAEAVVVEDSEGRLLGLASMHRLSLLTDDNPLALLTSVVVKERSRGTGAGRRLVEHLCARARELGCERVVVNTHLRRSDAHAFYERLGFEFTGRRYVRSLTMP